jgi:hypothetical protein
MNPRLKKFLQSNTVIVKYNRSSLAPSGESGPRIKGFEIGDKIMKRFQLLLTFAALMPALLAFSTPALSQSDAQAQKSFDELKTLAGTWKGQVSVDPPQADMSTNQPMWVTMRVTSRGNALVHEMKQPGTPDDPKKDDPVTMIYLDNDRLNLVHYCDAGNRPHMVARPSADGKTVEFDFADLSGGNQFGHMYHVVFKLIDANHHTEDWTFMMPGDKLMHGHMDLQRVN